MEFEVKISIKGEERGGKIDGCSYEVKGKKKKLEESKEGIGVKKEKVHTKKERRMGEKEWC